MMNESHSSIFLDARRRHTGEYILAFVWPVSFPLFSISQSYWEPRIANLQDAGDGVSRGHKLKIGHELKLAMK